jgi:hypothetical protein
MAAILVGPDFGIATLQRALAEFKGLPQSPPLNPRE